MTKGIPDLTSTYGAMFVGVLFATFFQGILTLQAYLYFDRFPKDSWVLKSLVAVVWTLDLVHLILISQACYHYVIASWGDVAALGFSTRELDTHLAFVGLTSFICQVFFLYRIWIFSSRNIPLTLFLTLGCLTSLSLDLGLSTILLTRSPSVTVFAKYTPEVVATFAIGAAIDLIMAGLLCYFLERGKSGFNESNSIVSRVMQFTIATGLFTSLLAIASLVGYLVRPDGFYHIAIHFSLGRMYTNALLATLNSRHYLRQTMQTSIAVPKAWASGSSGLTSSGSPTGIENNNHPGPNTDHGILPNVSDGVRVHESKFVQIDYAYPLQELESGVISMDTDTKRNIGV